MAGVLRSAMAGVESVLSKPYRTRSVEFRSNGRVAFQSGADSGGAARLAWRDHAELVTAPLLRMAGSLDYGLIRPGIGYGWGAGTQSGPPVMDELYDLNRHMWGRKVLDAHGAQLLTRQHLDQARDLSGWLVTEVATDRFLVEAADRAPWWDTYAPDPDVVASARRDFGDMIITLADIEADPHGWLPGRGRPNE